MKTCCTCGVKKLLFEFNKHKNRKDGHQTSCKPCNKEYVLKHYYENQEQISDQKKQKYPEVRDKILQYGKEYYNNNKAQSFAKSARRRATKLQRTPKWIKDVFIDEIKIIYKRAQIIKAFTEEVWHVDHIVPLQGKKVSGLHVPWNLQLLPAEENLSKGNKFSP
jgi:hypothetical protein